MIYNKEVYGDKFTLKCETWNTRNSWGHEVTLYHNAGLSKIHAAHIIRKIDVIIDELKNEAELAFSMYCDEEMCCAWRASNGEAGYSKTGKRLWQEVEEQNKRTA